MRTYIGIDSTRGEPELAMACNCGKTVYLNEFVDKAVRPSRIKTINLLRLAEWLGRFASEHASCPDQPKPVDDIPF